MSWQDVGNFLKKNGQGLTGLVGSLLLGNVPGAFASGVGLVASATGTSEPVEALMKLQQDPTAMIELRRIASEEKTSIRQHIEAIHEQTQQTIRQGDQAADPYVRHTRPKIARQSWYLTGAYVLATVLGKFLNVDVFALEVAIIISTPAWAYLGLRTVDKTDLFKRKLTV